MLLELLGCSCSGQELGRGVRHPTLSTGSEYWVAYSLPNRSISSPSLCIRGEVLHPASGTHTENAQGGGEQRAPSQLRKHDSAFLV